MEGLKPVVRKIAKPVRLATAAVIGTASLIGCAPETTPLKPPTKIEEEQQVAGSTPPSQPFATPTVENTPTATLHPSEIIQDNIQKPEPTLSPLEPVGPTENHRNEFLYFLEEDLDINFLDPDLAASFNSPQFYQHFTVDDIPADEHRGTPAHRQYNYLIKGKENNDTNIVKLSIAQNNQGQIFQKILYIYNADAIKQLGNNQHAWEKEPSEVQIYEATAPLIDIAKKVTKIDANWQANPVHNETIKGKVYKTVSGINTEIGDGGWKTAISVYFEGGLSRHSVRSD